MRLTAIFAPVLLLVLAACAASPSERSGEIQTPVGPLSWGWKYTKKSAPDLYARQRDLPVYFANGRALACLAGRAYYVYAWDEQADAYRAADGASTRREYVRVVPVPVRSNVFNDRRTQTLVFLVPYRPFSPFWAGCLRGDLEVDLRTRSTLDELLVISFNATNKNYPGYKVDNPESRDHYRHPRKLPRYRKGGGKRR